MVMLGWRGENRGGGERWRMAVYDRGNDIC